MTSQEQTKANRKNAKLGGVKTDEGKAVSKYNALKHGLLSQEVLMEDENEENLFELEKRLRSELKPATEIELLLVDRIIANFWRLRRLLKLEDGVVIDKSFSGNKQIILRGADLFFRYETMLERSIYKALHELQRMQAARAGEKPLVPIAVDIDISKG